MSHADRERWDSKYAAKPAPERLNPDDWLTQVVSGLTPGQALELACGAGHNSVWLASQGWQLDAVDISPIGLAQAEELARTCGVRVNWIAADLDEFTPAPETYDLVIVFRFLDRVRLPGIVEHALRPGGRLIYETFTTAHTRRPDSHMKNPAFALEPGELPRLFPRLEIVSYAECALPDRDVARFVGVKRDYAFSRTTAVP
jgi:2-polyprenyl-3-methyl-5-hydroxy-6-metoxy-1,4-benzoquinol methylase